MVGAARPLPETVVFNAVGSWKNTPEEEQRGSKVWIISEAPDARGVPGTRKEGRWIAQGKVALWVDKEEWKNGGWQEHEELRGFNWVGIEGSQWIIVAAYRQHSQLREEAQTEEWWADLVAAVRNRAHQEDKAILIAGDFNAEHDIWLGEASEVKSSGERSNPRHGERLAQVSCTADLYAVYDRKDPFTRLGYGKPSALDVVWTSHRIKGSLRKEWGNSDHAYLYLGYRAEEREGRDRTISTLATKPGMVVNTKKVTHLMVEEGKKEGSTQDLWTKLAEFCKTYSKPRREVEEKKRGPWNDDLTLLRKVAAKAAKRHADRPKCSKRKKDYQEARRIYRLALRNARREEREAATKLLLNQVTTEIEAVFRQKKCVEATLQRLEKTEAPSPQREDEEPRETAERLKAHNFPQETTSRDDITWVSNHNPPGSLWKKVLIGSAKRAAAGPDGINAKMAHKFLRVKEVEDMLKEEMDGAWEIGRPEKGWRDVRIKYIPKPGRKTWTEAATWRPVGVMNTVGKLYSAGVAIDLLTKTNWRAPVYGARKGVGCVDITLRHANLIRHVARIERLPTVDQPTLVAVYFDVKAAFPATRTWHLKEALGRHPEIGHWAKDISTRAEYKEVKVEWEGLSQNIVMRVPGLDQGDPASPTLWQLVMEGILLRLRTRLDLSTPPDTMELSDSYADDGFVGRVGTGNLQTIHRNLLEIAKALEDVEDFYGFKMPKEKMEVVIKGRHKPNSLIAKGWPSNLPRPTTDAITRLGMRIPIDLGRTNFSTLQTREGAAKIKMRILRGSWRTHAWTLEGMVMAATAIILPTLAYGCELWGSVKILETAEKMWYNIIKSLLGWHGPIQRKALYAALRFERIGTICGEELPSECSKTPNTQPSYRRPLRLPTR